ncbi:MAG: AAA family ATPase [Blastocatellia bacterium]
MIHLQSISLSRTPARTDEYPFSLPLIRDFPDLPFRSNVTFLTGENGSGKSTLLEAIAAGAGAIAAGATDIDRDESLAPARKLGKFLKFNWRNKTRRGFYLRAEDFFGFALRMQREVRDLEQIARDFEGDYSGYALGLAQGAALGQRQALIEKYGENLDARSHGESFLKMFQARFVPNGLYLLDEPEAPLSPQRQLALLAMLKEMTEQDAQFIIATHSPILMAFPGAVILHFDGRTISEIAWEDTEHVSLTRSFLNNPQMYLRHL